MDRVVIKVRENGPLLVRGDIELVDHEGRRFEVGDDIVLCRCGASERRPFCDGSHRRVGFASTCRAGEES
ncbi:MAG: CDGSH iron-sulfur domain-containing protein [Actinomycetota bacterium]|nr:CDGSH iron-sulfur domain-containing protein [Actinomycetota bacterium]